MTDLDSRGLEAAAKELWRPLHPDWPARWGWTELSAHAKGRSREVAADAVRAYLAASLPPDGEPQNPYRTHLEGPGPSIRYDDNRGGGPGAGMQNAAAMAWDEGFAAGAAARTAEIVKWLRTTKGDEWMRGQDAARSVVSRFGGGES